MRRIPLIAILLLCAGAMCIALSLGSVAPPHFKSAHAQLALTGAGAGAPGGGASCTFPTGIGLQARYRADVGVTTVGGNVTAVADQSGNANTLTATGTVPFLATGSAHGQPAFGFLNADAGALNTAGLTINMGTGEPISVFVVGQMLTATASYGGLVSMIGGVGDSDYNGTRDFTFGRAVSTNAVYTTINTGTSTANSISLATQYRMGWTLDASNNLVGYLNNVGNTPFTRVYNNTATMQIAIGNRISAGVISGGAWEGPISEVVVANTVLNSTQLNNLDTYFTCQWGS